MLTEMVFALPLIEFGGGDWSAGRGGIDVPGGFLKLGGCLKPGLFEVEEFVEEGTEGCLDEGGLARVFRRGFAHRLQGLYKSFDEVRISKGFISQPFEGSRLAGIEACSFEIAFGHG